MNAAPLIPKTQRAAATRRGSEDANSKREGRRRAAHVSKRPLIVYFAGGFGPALTRAG
jgi:hypothetical protein